MPDVLASNGPVELLVGGLTRVAGPFSTPADAWRCANTLVATDKTIEAPIEVLGTFVIPPPGGSPSREFQTLHFDFGIPLVPSGPADVARATALHVPRAASATQALTRFVPLAALTAAHRWPSNTEIVRRFAAYGESHGTRQTNAGYCEGSLARIVEAALGRPPELPSMRVDPDFLCGTEFATLDDEVQFFHRRGMRIDAVTIEIQLRPGELLVFDNLAMAHGRRGRRTPGELHQLVLGHRALDPRDQSALRDRFLTAFTGDGRDTGG